MAYGAFQARSIVLNMSGCGIYLTILSAGI